LRGPMPHRTADPTVAMRNEVLPADQRINPLEAGRLTSRSDSDDNNSICHGAPVDRRPPGCAQRRRARGGGRRRGRLHRWAADNLRFCRHARPPCRYGAALRPGPRLPGRGRPHRLRES
jgi:hypothetical protein